MTVAVPKVAGVGTCAAAAAHGRGMHPAMLHAMRASGADADRSASAASGAGRDGVRASRGERVDMHRRRRKRLRRRGQAPALRPGRHRSARGPDGGARHRRRDRRPELVAADLLGQAEHGPTSPAVLVTTSAARRAVLAAVDRRLETWPTAEVAGAAWRDLRRDHRRRRRGRPWRRPTRSRRSTSRSRRDDPAVVPRSAEQLRLAVPRPQATVAYADKGSGRTTSCRPRGAARYTGGLWVGKFLKTVTYQRVTPEGSASVAPAVAAISHAEGFAGHARTAELRLERAGTGVR